MEARTVDGEGLQRSELKEFSLRPEKFDGKGNFEGWVYQLEEYVTLGQWSEEERASLLFLSLTGGALKYFIGLPECIWRGAKPSGSDFVRKQTPVLHFRS